MTQPYLSPEAEAYRQQQIEEYDQYRAAVPIATASGALAYAAGHPVPASNVDSKGRVVLARHVCGYDHEVCEHANEPVAWSEEGMAVPTEAGKRRQAARKAAETRAANKDSATDASTSEAKKG